MLHTNAARFSRNHHKRADKASPTRSIVPETARTARRNTSAKVRQPPKIGFPIRRRAAGVINTIKMDGKMKKVMGNNILTGA